MMQGPCQGMPMQNVNSYIRERKSWSIKNVLSNYFKAINLTTDINREYQSGKDVPFERLRQLSEILFDCKEELHLIYKRLVDPRKGIFEDADKYMPNNAEINFIHNVGLLFHKAMVARELKYMLEYYETDIDEEYYDLKHSLDDNIHRLVLLIEKGVSLIPAFLANYSDDVVVLSYLLEHKRYVKSVMGMDVETILSQHKKSVPLQNYYIKVAQYFLKSGWNERAKKVLYEALKKEPKNKAIRELLEQCG